MKWPRYFRNQVCVLPLLYPDKRFGQFLAGLRFLGRHRILNVTYFECCRNTNLFMYFIVSGGKEMGQYSGYTDLRQKHVFSFFCKVSI